MLGAGLSARVLEPSPPTVATGPYLADDPVDPAASDDGGDLVVVPTGLSGDRDWGQWLAERPDAAAWVADRWLGGDRRLPAPPPTLAETRQALHRLAAYVIAPARHVATTKFGLRWTLGGFGTPFFAEDRQIRVEGRRLVDQRGAGAGATTITTLRAAAAFLDTGIDEKTAAEADSPPLGDVDEILPIDEAAARFLGGWYGMAFAALELVRADVGSVDPSRPQLWPGHFDPAIELGDDARRGSYGASPGDSAIDEPYLYVSVWSPEEAGLDPDDPFWNAPSFPGRVLRLSEFPTDTDPVDVAAGFWRRTRDRLG